MKSFEKYYTYIKKFVKKLNIYIYQYTSSHCILFNIIYMLDFYLYMYKFFVLFKFPFY